MDITIYNKEKVNLSPISFINDIQNQVKIRDIDTNSVEFRTQLGYLFSKISNLLGIKETILDINKIDIVDLILMKYKSFSLEEIDYCFKLERFNSLGKKTEHYQLLNAEYISNVLEKYKKWKEFKIKTNNISLLKKVSLETKVDHTAKNNDIVMRFLTEYEESSFIEENKFYIYDIINKKGLFPNNKEHKESIKKDAIYLLTNKYQNRKASSRAEQTRFKREMKNISLGSGGDVIRKCKQLFMEEFFRGLYKDDEKVIEFKKNFK
jgi:hypothetical protein